MRVDIGVASYRNPDKLLATLASIRAMSTTDWRCFIIHNPSPDSEGRAAAALAREMEASDPRFVFHMMPMNVGYVGAVNKLFHLAETEFVIYCDNDVEILTKGWDADLCALLDWHHEVAQVFPGSGHYGFHNGVYNECLWNAGYCWAMRKSVLDWPDHRTMIGELMDAALGHHEEVDLMIRLRLAGYRIACIPSVQVVHHESSTSSPESAKRIHAGVVRFMNKWNRYFVGDAITYPNPDPDSGEKYDERFLRYTDWPPCALYLERWTLAQFPQWNSKPRTIETQAGPMDVIEILKPKGCYIGRAI